MNNHYMAERKRNAAGEEDERPEPKKTRGEGAIYGKIDESQYRQQNEEFFELHDFLKRKTEPKDWIETLELNCQAIPEGMSEVSYF